MTCKRLFMLTAALAGMTLTAWGQTITVSAPNGGERWMLGDPVTIVWTSSDVTGLVRIVLFRGGTAAGNRIGYIAEDIPAAAGSYTWTAGAYFGGSAAAGGDYYIRVRSQESSIQDDSNAGFTLASRQPNIRIESMREIGWDHTFLPRVFTAGDTVTIQYHLRNDSDYSAGPFHVGLRVGGTIVARNAYAELVNGAESAGEFTWTAVCGSRVEVVADCNDEVAESNEGDNVFTDPGLACTQSDLNFFAPLSCSSGGATIKAGLPYEFRAQVDSTPVRAENVRVTGGVIGGARLYDHTFPVMAGDGGLEAVSFVWEVPEGPHRVYFEIDPDGAITESNERNNRQELAVTAVVSTPATESYDLRISIDRGRSFGRALGEIEVPMGRPLTILGEVLGATGSIRDFKVTGAVQFKSGLKTKVYEQDFNDPSMRAVPFSFTWTPDALGEVTIYANAALGPHAVSVGVVDGNPANNTSKVSLRVVKPKPSLRR